MRTIIAAAALAVVLAGPAGAEPGPIGQWLMNQPVTLWDRGMDRAKAEVERAVDAMANLTTNRPGRGVDYDWENNEIGLHVFVFNDRGAITHERCNVLRRAFLATVVFGTPTRPDGSPFIQSSETWATTKKLLTLKVGQWFSHHGYRKQERDAKLAEKMARIVFVEVWLRGEKGALQCRGRILEFEAASKPIN